jgi:hypothetical protein
MMRDLKQSVRDGKKVDFGGETVAEVKINSKNGGG